MATTTYHIGLSLFLLLALPVSSAAQQTSPDRLKEKVSGVKNSKDKGPQPQDAPAPFGPLPTSAQLNWQETEMYCLIHFTPTTFQNKEWGFGDASPQIFRPTAFDAEQIAAAAKAGGLNALVSVAKHHDGFCLWPTESTGYNISKSPWMNGNGDMVKAFMQAAHKHNMQFGVYCSAWDRNFPEYGRPQYVQAYKKQLEELYTSYGPLFTSWHDGANGGDGYYGGANETRTIDRTTYYGWDSLWAMTRRMQPGAVIFSDIGPDVRWVGNERGEAGETCWATFTPMAPEGSKPAPGFVKEEFLTTGQRNGKYWIPAECDVPLRGGWFYHANEDDKVKTPDQLFDLYCKSVGRGACLNLGLAPNTDGVLHENDVQSLKAFGKKITQTFARNLARNAKITATNTRAGNTHNYGTGNLSDDDRYSYWATDDTVTNAGLLLELPKPQSFNLIRLRENIKLGQRLDSVVVLIWRDNEWSRIASATSIGANRIIRLKNMAAAEKVRLQFFSPVAIALSDFGLFREAATDAGFKKAVSHKQTDKSKWKVVKVSGNEMPGQPQMAIDGDPGTFWQSSASDMPYIIVDLGEKKDFSAFSYLPRQDKQKEGLVKRFKLEYSADGKNWNTALQGEFANIAANPILQYMRLPARINARFVRLTALNTTAPGESKFITVAELEVYE